MTDPFFQQLSELATREPTRVKWVIIPDAQLKWTLSERLVLSGQNWANFRFVTPFELAVDTAAPILLERAVNPKPEDLGPSLIHRLLSDESKASSYFRPLLDQPGMAENLWRFVLEVRMAGISASRLSRVLSGPKKAELSALLRRYQGYLETHL